jgi:hypothetical protein
MSGNNNGKKPKTTKKVRANPQRRGKSMSKNATAGSETKKIVSLSKSARDYARCMANPFTGPLSGLPVHPAQFSKKFRTWAKGTFSTQTTNGIGWITCTPEYGVSNNALSVYTSIPGGTGANWFDTLTVGQFTTSVTNSEYATTNIGISEIQLEYRVIGSGLRIRYIGTELNRGGQMVAILDQNHSSLQFRSLSSVDGEEVSKRFPIDRSWTTVLYRPVDNDDFEFRTSLPVNTGSNNDSINYMGFAIQGEAGVATQYEYEFFTSFEAFGKNVRAMSVSHVDPVGFGAVHAMSQLGSSLQPSKADPKTNESHLVVDSARYIAENTSHATHIGRNKIQKVNDSLEVVNNTLDTVKHTGEIFGDIFTGVSAVLDFLF